MKNEMACYWMNCSSLGEASRYRRLLSGWFGATSSAFVDADPANMVNGSGAARSEYQAGKIESRIDGIIELYAGQPAGRRAELYGQITQGPDNSTTIARITAPEVLAIAGTETYSVTFSQNGGALNGSHKAICEGPPVIAGPSSRPDMVGGVFILDIASIAFAGIVTITVLGERL